MTRLTMTRMALGSLRGQKKRYFSLASGIFLAVFFATALVLASASLGKTALDDYRARMGEQDIALIDTDTTEEEILQTGIAQRVGTVEVFGEIAASPEADAARVTFGRYDETAAALAHPACLEGRMPQQADEIALEASALNRLRLAAEVGDTVTLYFYPLMGRNQFASEPVARTFTLTGVLAEKASHLEISRVTFEMHYTRFPAALASEAEEIAPGSLPARHLLLELARPLTEAQMDETIPGLYHLCDYQISLDADLFHEVLPALLAIGVVALSLLVASGMGIVNAFAANLAERSVQIGMMRAVGATRRQVRRIFGREALLLALLCAPAAIALSCLAVALLLRLLDLGALYAPPALLLTALAFSVLCVMLAAAIPLRRAGRVSPMQAIRDTQFLRAARRARVKSQKRFPRGIARRPPRAHPLSRAKRGRAHPARPVPPGALRRVPGDGRRRHFPGQRMGIRLRAASLFFRPRGILRRSRPAAPLHRERPRGHPVAALCGARGLRTEGGVQPGAGRGDGLPAAHPPSQRIPGRTFAHLGWLGNRRARSVPGSEERAGHRGRSLRRGGDRPARGAHPRLRGGSATWRNRHRGAERGPRGDRSRAGYPLSAALGNARRWNGKHHFRAALCRTRAGGAIPRIRQRHVPSEAEIAPVPAICAGKSAPTAQTLPSPLRIWNGATHRLPSARPWTGPLPAIWSFSLAAGMAMRSPRTRACRRSAYLRTVTANSAWRSRKRPIPKPRRKSTRRCAKSPPAWRAHSTIPVRLPPRTAGYHSQPAAGRGHGAFAVHRHRAEHDGQRPLRSIRADRRTIGTLRAVGAPLSAILGLYRRQAGILLAAGALAGFALSAALLLGLCQFEYFRNTVFAALPAWGLPALLAAYAAIVFFACALTLRARLRNLPRASIVESIREL